MNRAWLLAALAALAACGRRSDAVSAADVDLPPALRDKGPARVVQADIPPLPTPVPYSPTTKKAASPLPPSDPAPERPPNPADQTR